MKKVFRYIAFTLLLTLILSLLCSCASSRKVPAGKLALTEVGKVGEYDVLYEEYYFLAQNYLETAREGFDGTDDELREYVKGLVETDIITNHAILALCDKEGVEYDRKDLDKSVQTVIDEMIASDFGDRDTYLEVLEESHMTDHYVRFVTEVDVIYSMLPLKLAENGKIETDAEAVTEYVKKNFVRTWHVMIANDNGDSAETNLATAENALAKLQSGETTMYKLIGSKDNEDVFMPVNGYCFAKGAMDKPYEDAAFALKVGEYSDVVSAKGENGLGEQVDCYYVMQRLEIDDDYIGANYDDVYTAYSDAIVFEELSKISEALKFEPNSFAESLDILDLETPESGFDFLPLIIIGACVLVAGAITAVVIIIVKKKKKAALIRR